MKQIIVPVDLSKNSKEALRYAVHLARKAKADITIVHCYSLLHKAVIYTTKKGHTEKDPEKWIQKRIAKILGKTPDLKVQYKIIKGDVVDSLRRLVEITAADLVVMGCQGTNENIDTFLGSTAGAMVKTTNIPVLVVPPRYKYSGIEKVVFAAKNTFVRFMGTLDPIIDIKQMFQPHVQLLHLGEEQEPIPDQSFSILQVINDITRYGNDNFNESINEYLSQYHADLLCVIRRKRGFLEKTLGPTRTPADKFHTDIPVLVLIGEDY
jgi:nucleotide-binding universal stress UspA family protein